MNICIDGTMTEQRSLRFDELEPFMHDIEVTLAPQPNSLQLSSPAAHLTN